MPSLKTMVILGAMIFLITVVVILPSKKSADDQVDVFESGATLIGYVRGIEGKTPEGRRQFVKDKLGEFAIPFVTMPFDTIISTGGRSDTLHGENIIATMGSKRTKIVVGAHYDAVPNAPGANDNGAGVAVLLELIRTMKSEKVRHTIDFCFFDQEENNLLGSGVYVRCYAGTYTPVGMINLDVEGTGDEIYVGPVGGGDDEIIMKYVHAAKDQLHYRFVESETYPSSDYQSFAHAGMENISISVVPTGDAEKLIKWLTTGSGKFDNPDDIPIVMKVMHTPEDKSEYVTPEALYMSYQFTKTVLMSLDNGEE